MGGRSVGAASMDGKDPNVARSAQTSKIYFAFQKYFRISLKSHHTKTEKKKKKKIQNTS